MGRHPSGKIPVQPLRYITERHHEIMRRLIAGETQHKIAAEMGITESRLSIICNSPLFQEALAEKRGKVEDRFVESTASVKDRIDKLQDKAINILEKIISETTDEMNNVIPIRLKKETALNILEIAGNGKKTPSGVNGKENLGDVIQLIKEGYKLAKQLQDEEIDSNKGVKTLPEPVNITPTYTDISATAVSPADSTTTNTQESNTTAETRFVPILVEDTLLNAPEEMQAVS